jgi:hypothetical protein
MVVGLFLCMSWYEVSVVNQFLTLGKTMRVREKELAYW